MFEFPRQDIDDTKGLVRKEVPLNVDKPPILPEEPFSPQEPLDQSKGRV